MTTDHETCCSDGPYCVFNCGGRPYAVRVEAVSEIFLSGRLAPIPLAPPYIVGLCAHRGGVLTIATAAEPRLDVESGSEQPRPEGTGPPTRDRRAKATLVLRTHRGAFGLMIERRGVALAESGRLREPDVPSMRGFLAIVGELDCGERTYSVLDPDLCWSNLRSMTDRWYAPTRQTTGATALLSVGAAG